jgi:hypothetical protein
MPDNEKDKEEEIVLEAPPLSEGDKDYIPTHLNIVLKGKDLSVDVAFDNFKAARKRLDEIGEGMITVRHLHKSWPCKQKYCYEHGRYIEKRKLPRKTNMDIHFSSYSV